MKVTELEFIKALLGLISNTAPGSDKVLYSDIENLSDKSKRFTLQNESFPKAKFLETGHKAT